MFLGVSTVNKTKFLAPSERRALVSNTYSPSSRLFTMASDITRKGTASVNLEFSTSLLLHGTEGFLGGEPTNMIATQKVYPLDAVSGVTEITSLKNQVGAGVLTVESAGIGYALTWTGNGSGGGKPVAVVSDGYIELAHQIGATMGMLRLYVNINSLKVGQYRLFIENVKGAVIPVIDTPTATDGTTIYRCVHLKNLNPSIQFAEATVTITEQAKSGVELYVGADPATATQTPQTIADNGTPPVGVSFSKVAETGEVPIGGSKALWLKVYVPPTATVETSFDWATMEVRSSI